MSQHQISKSSYIKGLQCKKHLYLYKHYYNLKDEISEIQESVFDRGHEVGRLAQNLFPGGYDASPKNNREIDEGVALTSELIENGEKVIYEAGFVYDEVLILADILVKDGDSWKIYEVKSSTSISETYLIDAAVQYYVLNGCGLNISDVSIVFINNKYTRQGEIDIHKLFNIKSVKDKIRKYLNDIPSNVKNFKKVIELNSIPNVPIGEQCFYPYKCSYYNFCWKNIPEDSVFEISGMHLWKKFELYNEGVIRIEDIKNDTRLSKNQLIQVNAVKTGEKIVNVSFVEEFLKEFKHPLYFMDFESFQTAIPPYENCRPYQQIPFQYSVHRLKDKDEKLEHYELLADPNSDPRLQFIEGLLDVLEDEGSIIVYNKSFEITRLREIANDFPVYSSRTEKVIERIVDLMIPFQKKEIYYPEMNGSFSIKYVLPALVPELTYQGMGITDGGIASISYGKLLHPATDLFTHDEIRRNLLEYCKLDTLAMAKIFFKLQEFVNNK